MIESVDQALLLRALGFCRAGGVNDSMYAAEYMREIASQVGNERSDAEPLESIAFCRVAYQRAERDGGGMQFFGY